MIAVDTNILVYAHRKESRHHETSRGLMRALAEGPNLWAIPWPCFYEFFSVVTNPRIWKDLAIHLRLPNRTLNVQSKQKGAGQYCPNRY